MRRPLTIAIVRGLNAAFFFATAAYCLLAYSPFAYQQFLKPEVISWQPDFIAVHTALFWLVLLLTVLTVRLKAAATIDRRAPGEATVRLKPRSTTAIWLARGYVAVLAAAGAALIARPLLPTVGNSRSSFVAAVLALVPPVWLAIVDHLDARPFAMRSSDARRLFHACLATATCVWGAYAAGAPLRLHQIVGVDLPPRDLLLGIASSATLHLAAFVSIFLVLSVVGALSRIGRNRGAIEYWLLVAVSGAGVASWMYWVAFQSIAFAGAAAAAAAIAIGCATALAWSGVARQRAHPADDGSPLPALDLWLAPIGGPVARRSRLVHPAAVLLLLPLAAYWLVEETSSLDWNFLIQKSGVLLVWVTAFASAHALIGTRRATPRLVFALAPLVAVGFVQTTTPLAARSDVADRYAAVDMSFRLIHDAGRVRAGETAQFYTRLKANTLVAPGRVSPPSRSFTTELRRASRPPHVFLFLIDSLRRDYVSAYNPAVTFTPAMGSFAADSFVFDRAFTRYAGTGLAVPSIWAGGMLIHAVDQRPFEGRNALWRLLDRDGYRRVMGVDSIMRDLLPARAALVELDKGVPPMECDFCRTMRELEGVLDRSTDARPVFSYTLPQNVHIAVASKHRVAADRSYPGFFAPVADSVRRVDECFGDLVAYLKRTGRYEDSIIILASDHGDSLGEEGRWGHAYFMVPEVMRIPLIVHLPPAMRDRVDADLQRVTFSTDLTPTLYALLGHDPAELGSLYGSPLFVPAGGRPVDRRDESFLLASSYGAVYGILRDNGRTLFAADAVDSREAAFDLSGGRSVRMTLPASVVSVDRQLILDQLGRLAALYHFIPDS